jgi:two-component system cell cycle response regulator DivK
MGNLKIVVVDDDAEFLEEIEEVLHSKGYSVEVVSDPFAAVEAVARSKPDAVLLDLKMKGKSGLEIAAELSESPETAGIPVIAMTAHFAEEELEKLKESGVVRSFLTKPLSIPEVMAKLEEVQG